MSEAKGFKTVGVVTKQNVAGLDEALQLVQKILASLNIEALYEPEIDKRCDLIIVMGGDGSLLRSARMVVELGIPILGINYGRLGFLADISPDSLEQDLRSVLMGKYVTEQRSMLRAEIRKQGKSQSSHLALNEIALHHGDIARLIEFEIYIDDEFVVQHRADGMIVSTPTGSTAYALSAGGPIIYPTLDVLTLLPMFPHTLSARPLVISNTAKIKVVMTNKNKVTGNLSCDGQTHMGLEIGDEIHISCFQEQLQVLHPNSYQYYKLLREKLGWTINIKR